MLNRMLTDRSFLSGYTSDYPQPNSMSQMPGRHGLMADEQTRGNTIP